MSIASESGARCCDDAGKSGVVIGNMINDLNPALIRAHRFFKGKTACIFPMK